VTLPILIRLELVPVFGFCRFERRELARSFRDSLQIQRGLEMNTHSDGVFVRAPDVVVYAMGWADGQTASRSTIHSNIRSLTPSVKIVLHRFAGAM
jgi:hypothetical protein